MNKKPRGARDRGRGAQNARKSGGAGRGMSCKHRVYALGGLVGLKGETYKNTYHSDL